MKSELELLREWYAYNSRVRRRYLRLLMSLPVDRLTRDRGASFPSIIDIFTHVLDAYRWWFLYVYPDRIHEWKRLRETGLSLTEIKREATKINVQVMNFLDKLTDLDLDHSFTYHIWTRTRKRSKRTVTRRLRDMLWHLVEEELQHRGEMNALLWQIDVDPPISEWHDWQRPPSKLK